MSNPLLKAILAMDAYNRGYKPSIELTGSTLGSSTILFDSEDLGFKLDSNGNPILNSEGNPTRKDENIGFYGIAYEYNGEVVVSYRGVDDGPLDDLHGYGIGIGGTNTEQGLMAAEFYRAIVDQKAGSFSFMANSFGCGLAQSDMR